MHLKKINLKWMSLEKMFNPPPPLLSLLLLLLLSNGSKLARGGKEKKRKTKRDWNAKKGCFAGNAGLGEAVRYGILRYMWCGSGGGGGWLG